MILLLSISALVAAYCGIRHVRRLCAQIPNRNEEFDLFRGAHVSTTRAPFVVLD